LQEAADQAVAPVVAQIRAPVAPMEILVTIMDLTEWVVKEQMQHNKINMNINTSSGRQLRDRINISRRRDLRLRINININTNREGHLRLRISPIYLANLLPMPEECGNSLPITGNPK
jgi:hypothetical protein